MSTRVTVALRLFVCLGVAAVHFGIGSVGVSGLPVSLGGRGVALSRVTNVRSCCFVMNPCGLFLQLSRLIVAVSGPAVRGGRVVAGIPGVLSRQAHIGGRSTH